MVDVQQGGAEATKFQALDGHVEICALYGGSLEPAELLWRHVVLLPHGLLGLEAPGAHRQHLLEVGLKLGRADVEVGLHVFDPLFVLHHLKKVNCPPHIHFE